MQIAVILCGGKGTRLHPLTHDVPKPMLPIKGKPVLEYQIEYLKSQGISTIILAVSHLKEQIMDYFKNGSEYGVNIIYVIDSDSGTGGSLRLLKYLNLNEPILVMNGDTLFHVNLNHMRKYHKNDITIATSLIDNPDRYGVVQDGQIQEKAKVEKGFVSIGLYIIEPMVFNMIPIGFCSLERDIFPEIKQGFYHYEGDWFDMGVMNTYLEKR